MIRIVVNYDLIARPVPVSNDGIVVGKNAPVEVVEPEAFAISTLKVEYVLGADATREVAMRPRMIQVEPCVIAAGIVAHPFVVARVSVRDFRMSLMVGGNTMLFGLMMLVGLMMVRRLMVRCRSVRLLRVRVGGCGARAVRGNVSPANFGVTAGAIMALAAFFLRKKHQAGQSR